MERAGAGRRPLEWCLHVVRVCQNSRSATLHVGHRNRGAARHRGETPRAALQSRRRLRPSEWLASTLLRMLRWPQMCERCARRGTEQNYVLTLAWISGRGGARPLRRDGAASEHAAVRNGQRIHSRRVIPQKCATEVRPRVCKADAQSRGCEHCIAVGVHAAVVDLPSACACDI